MTKELSRGDELIIEYGPGELELSFQGLINGVPLNFVLCKDGAPGTFSEEIEIIGLEVEGEDDGDLLVQDTGIGIRHLWKIKGWIGIESKKKPVLVEGVYDSMFRKGALKVL